MDETVSPSMLTLAEETRWRRARMGDKDIRLEDTRHKTLRYKRVLWMRFGLLKNRREEEWR
jgi:hypothetical protein